jgi:hypothetical protein
MLLMASLEPIVFDVPMMRRRMTEEPYRSALAKVWRVTELEGVFGHHMANSDFARAVRDAEHGRVNTDDQNFVEFSFARTVGTKSAFIASDVIVLARKRNEQRPAVTGGEVDWDAVEDQQVASFITEGSDPPVPPTSPNEPQAMRQRRFRMAALAHLLRGNTQQALEMWKKQPRAPRDQIELMFIANAYNEMGSEEAVPLIEKIRPWQPTEADALLAHLRWRQHRGAEAYDAMESALLNYRRDPWPHFDEMSRAITLAVDMARADPSGLHSKRLYDAMSKPFTMDLLEDHRRRCLVRIATHIDSRTGSRLTPTALEVFEPHIPWDLDFLEVRLNAYLAANHPLTMKAAEDVDEYREAEQFPFDFELVPQPTTQPTTGPATGPATGPTTGPTSEPVMPLNAPAQPDQPASPPPSSGTDTGSAPSQPTRPAQQLPVPEADGSRGKR